jgi:predicted transcriptional regulator
MLMAQKGKKGLGEVIIEILQNGGSTGPTLLERVCKKNDTSKESFYRILRDLLKKEVINKHHNIYQLNRHWLQQLYRFSKKHIEENKGIDTDDILSFKEGDKITYKFSNPNDMGIYWAHTYDMIFEHHDPKIPILVFHPHEWLVHTRIASETFFLNRFNEDKKLVFFAIGGNTNFDKEFKKTWESNFRQIGIGINFNTKNTEYVNVLGDYVFKVSLSKKFNNNLESFFKIHKELNLENKVELEKLCSRKDSAKMVFIRSKKEAEVWRAKFKKYFFVPTN